MTETDKEKKNNQVNMDDEYTIVMPAGLKLEDLADPLDETGVETVEKTAAWEVIAPTGEVSEISEVVEEDETDAVEVGENTESDSDTDEPTKNIELSEPKRTIQMPGNIWADENVSKGLSGDGEQSVPKPGPSPEDAEIIERIKQRKIQNAARQKRSQRRLRAGIIIGIITVTAVILSLTNIFVVDSIEVKGNSHFTGEEIINIGHASAGKNIIYNAGKKEIVENLEDNPYIKSANVRRKLPSTLVIEVVERTEACALKYDDDYLVIDDEGTLLRKTNTVPKLTEVEGMVVSKIKLGETLGTKDSSLFKTSMSIIKAMRKSDMYFVRIDMSNKDEIHAYVYETLVVKADYETLKKNLENGRLHQVVEKLFEDGIQRGTITFNDDDTASFKPGL